MQDRRVADIAMHRMHEPAGGFVRMGMQNDLVVLFDQRVFGRPLVRTKIERLPAIRHRAGLRRGKRGDCRRLRHCGMRKRTRKRGEDEDDAH